MGNEKTLTKKLSDLEMYLRDLGSVAVAYSGGVDSALLITVANKVLGDRCIAITSVDAAMPEGDIDEAAEFCRERGIAHCILHNDPLQLDAYRHNRTDRCYHCKKYIFSTIAEEAARHGITNIAEGSNIDDLDDFRPGMKAIVEMGVLSPLREAGLRKSEIRELAHSMGIPAWDKPSAACLASRFAYGETITVERLRMVDRAEAFLHGKGFRQCRVRVHGDLARIELAQSDISGMIDAGLRDEVYSTLKEIGFTYISLDLKGYRTGSMNEEKEIKETENHPLSPLEY